MVARILLFFSSYTPLFAIFAIRFPTTSKIWWLVTFGFALCGLALFLLVTRRHEPQFYPVESVDESPAAAAYVATYILPFVTINEPGARDLIAYGVFFAVIGILYTRSSLVGVNPLVYMTPYRIYQIKTPRGETHVLFSRTRPNPGQQVNAARAFAGLLIRKEE